MRNTDGSNSAQLIIGNQRLDGKITELKQPLAVLSKVNRFPAHEASDGGGLPSSLEYVCVFSLRKALLLALCLLLRLMPVRVVSAPPKKTFTADVKRNPLRTGDVPECK